MVAIGYFWFWILWLREVWREVRRAVYRKVVEGLDLDDENDTGRAKQKSEKLWALCRQGSIAAELRGRNSITNPDTANASMLGTNRQSQDRANSRSSIAQAALDASVSPFLANLVTKIVDWEATYRKQFLYVSIRRKQKQVKSAGGRQNVVMKELVVHTDSDASAYDTWWKRIIVTPLVSRRESQALYSGAMRVTQAFQGMVGLRRKKSSKAAEDAESGQDDLLNMNSEGQVLLPDEVTAGEGGGTKDCIALAGVLCEALEALLVTHGVTSLPFCALEFVIVDTIIFMHRGLAVQAERRRQLFEYVAWHPDGPEQGLADVFYGGPNIPDAAAGMRLSELKRYARGDATVQEHHHLTVRKLERYVQHLQCEETESLRFALLEFARELQASQVKRDKVDKSEKSSQTWLFAERSTQTESVKTTSTSTEDISSTASRKPHGSGEVHLPEGIGPLRQELTKVHAEKSEYQQRTAALLEEAVCAEREAELLKSELLRTCQQPAAPLTSKKTPERLVELFGAEKLSNAQQANGLRHRGASNGSPRANGFEAPQLPSARVPR
eukprot:gnl/TRDRNA2_/TRDRNA2_159166_c0_seq1.p1 gnl/TRDRNA2_/TRDRNA2_159166_c0~~gnl/TRDRNA2_/TRDRNA2_159166_c0_seq1.p1  ORF type:complete len:647 (-),score=114.97 gnl/TRDRNA2_/TRDRNA2_159166_c0_seq1:73-1737(-)